MAEFRNPNIAANFQSGYAFGAQMRDDRNAQDDKYQLRQLAPDIISGNPDALAQGAAISPEMAGKYDDVGQREGQKLKNLYQYINNARKTGNTQAVNAALRQGAPYISKLIGKPAPTEWTPDMDAGWEQLGAKISMLGNGDKDRRNISVSAGSAIVDPDTGQVIYQNPGNGPVPVFKTDKQGRGWWIAPGQAPIPADGAQAPQGQSPDMSGDYAAGLPVETGDAATGLGDFGSAVGKMLSREGGYVGNDAGAGPTNFGINSRANPDIDVANLTPDAAKQIYKERYWDAIGADQLPPQIREAAFDAAVNQGVGKAKEMLAQSGGDPARFAALRGEHYASLAEGNPQKFGQYKASWDRRVADTTPQGGGINFGAPDKERPIPAGYQWNADHTQMEAIQGGPAQIAIDARADAAAARKTADDLKNSVKTEKAAQAQAMTNEAATSLLNSVERVLDSPGFDELGTVQGDAKIAFPMIRNDVKDANALLQNIGGKVALQTMARLKSTSATGSTGFGSLSAPELKLLQNSIETLDSPNISNKVLRQSLTIIRDTMRKVAEWKPSQSQGAEQAQPGGWSIEPAS